MRILPLLFSMLFFIPAKRSCPGLLYQRNSLLPGEKYIARTLARLRKTKWKE